jgi:hypothetical protein
MKEDSIIRSAAVERGHSTSRQNGEPSKAFAGALRILSENRGRRIGAAGGVTRVLSAVSICGSAEPEHAEAGELLDRADRLDEDGAEFLPVAGATLMQAASTVPGA